MTPPPSLAPRLTLVVGDAFADLSAHVSAFPSEGTDAQVGRMRWSSGGSATNVAAVLATLGDPVRLLARVGVDPAADVALRAAREAGVDLSLVQRDPEEPTGLCFVVVSPGGERTLFSARGANVALAVPGEGAAGLGEAAVLHLSGYSLIDGAHRETALALIEAASERDMAVSLDLCLPLVAARLAELLELLPCLSVVFGNQLELDALVPGAPPGSSAASLVARGVPVVVAKTGRRGCTVASARWSGAVPGYDVAAVDTTGCGDAFVAGFLHARSRGAPLPLCGALGNALGALAARRPGSGDALPGLGEIRSFLAGVDGREALLPLVGPATGAERTP